ncbi:MAG: CbtA family protein [Chloroflexi bacterium]|nr:CbtA family protein [Chloroflexota bacterium]
MLEVRTPSFGSCLRAALLAGLAAGVVAAAFHLAFTEIVIQSAISFEEAAHGEPAGEAGLVTRDGQRVGLFVGYVLYGGLWGLLLFGLVIAAGNWIPGRAASTRGLVLAAAAYWCAAVFPAIKYPPTPPGVGDPATIAVRQLAYVESIALAAGAIFGALLLARLVRRRNISTSLAVAAAAIFALTAHAVIYAVLPPGADSGGFPGEILASFRSLSVAGGALFWFILGSGFAFGLRRPNQPPLTAPA